MSVEALLDVAFADEARFGLTLAVHVVGRDGQVLAERYGPTAGPDVPLISWSMAKSITHLAAGVAGVDPAASGLFEAWEDERAAITVDHLLRMQDGLAWVEDYVDGSVSDVIEMLFGEGAADVVGYVAARPLVAAPGSRWLYSSGTTNLLADVVRRAAGLERGEPWRRWLLERVLHPCGMASADPRLDAAGSFVGSSYVYATAPDLARFGGLYLRGGDGLVDPAWVEGAWDPTPGVTEPGRGYGRQWWLWDDRPHWLVALGYETQRIVVDRERDLVAVRLGKTPLALGGDHVDAWLRDLVDAV